MFELLHCWYTACPLNAVVCIYQVCSERHKLTDKLYYFQPSCSLQGTCLIDAAVSPGSHKDGT